MISGVKIVPVDAVVVGAGQAGLSASHHLLRRGIEHVVLDAGPAPGGAWRERWPTLTMGRVDGVHDLPGAPLGDVAPDAPAPEVVAGCFARYESDQHLPVVRPVAVVPVSRQDDDLAGRLLVRARDGRAWAARAVLNTTGTWSRPFVPAWPGASSFAGHQLHTARCPGPAPFARQRVVVVGGRSLGSSCCWRSPAWPPRRGSPARPRAFARARSTRRPGAQRSPSSRTGWLPASRRAAPSR